MACKRISAKVNGLDQLHSYTSSVKTGRTKVDDLI